MSEPNDPHPWLALVGPTCSGKTWFAGELLQRFPLELVNLDSFQVYSHFRVGTGRADLAFEPAHLYGFVDPLESLTPARYAELARRTVAQMADRGRRPLFEGGSLSYLRELLRVHPLKLIGIRPAADAESEDLVSTRLASYSFDALMDEIRQGLELGYRGTQVLSDEVVYLPMVDYLDGRVDLPETIERMRRNLIERQRTQMREYADFDVQWFPSSRDSLPALVRAVEEVLGE